MKPRDAVLVATLVFTFGYGAWSMWRDFRGTAAYGLVAMLPWPSVNDVAGMICR